MIVGPRIFAKLATNVITLPELTKSCNKVRRFAEGQRLERDSSGRCHSV